MVIRLSLLVKVCKVILHSIKVVATMTLKIKLGFTLRSRHRGFRVDSPYTLPLFR